MAYKNSHISNEDLLMAADGELTRQRQAEVSLHLQHCWLCRGKMAGLERNIANFVEGYHTLLDSHVAASAAAEFRLKARLENRLQALLATPTAGLLSWVSHRKLAIAAEAAILFILVASLLTFRGQAQPGIVPNPALTPGETTMASKSEVCRADVRSDHVQIPESLKQAVFTEYGMPNAPRGSYEVDFLITPELGGSASLKNLWPEPYGVRHWNAHVKDVLEERLRNLVCGDKLDLSTAQREISANWVSAYRKYVR